jgi:hypothetical protein
VTWTLTNFLIEIVGGIAGGLRMAARWPSDSQSTASIVIGAVKH